MLYICKECQVVLQSENLKKSQCPIMTYHENLHKPLLSVDDDMADPVLRCLKKNYHVVNHRGAQRKWSSEGIKMGRFHPKIPHITLGFLSREECIDFYTKFKHLNHLMQDWNLEELHRFYRVADEVKTDVCPHILQSNTANRNFYNPPSSEVFYEIRFVGGGTKFSPLFILEQLHSGDFTGDQRQTMELLHKDFYSNYFDYCKDFFSVFDEICA